jgi:cytoskeletal protein RodZ
MANSKFNLSKGEEKKSKTWLWLLLGLAVIAIILFLWKPWVISESTEQTPPGTETLEEVTTPTEENVSGDTPAEGTSEQASGTETATATQGTTPSATPATQPAQSATPQVATPATQPSSTSTSTVSGDVETLAKEVIQGRYGNGDERKQKLGDRYSEIQRRVNKIYQENGYMW